MLVLVLSIIGPLVVVAVVLVIVFGAVRRAIDRAAESVAVEGVELDSGPVTVTVRMRDFRAPGIRSGGIRRVPGRIVLTRRRLHILGRPQRYGIFDRADLDRLTVGIFDGRLHLYSTDPPGATGSIDYRVPIKDPERWVAALTAAGALGARTG
ncbi:MAG: hypothetical protein H0T89_03465 [Deltaproteobacteria bacterium]|nr:hypothetical protein [Deltaproteobacteria bacterium]MDQ3299122.1 hypothetical protein [Myxococcota bacterium]